MPPLQGSFNSQIFTTSKLLKPFSLQDIENSAPSVVLQPFNCPFQSPSVHMQAMQMQLTKHS